MRETDGYNNAATDLISENLELMRALKNNNLEEFFNSLNDFKDSDTDSENFKKVEVILKQYGIENDARTNDFFFAITKVSRIINKRKDITEMDLDLIRWIIEKTNCKLDVIDTVDYKIEGAPDIKTQEMINNKIDDSTTQTSEGFGLPPGEF